LDIAQELGGCLQSKQSSDGRRPLPMGVLSACRCLDSSMIASFATSQREGVLLSLPLFSVCLSFGRSGWDAGPRRQRQRPKRHHPSPPTQVGGLSFFFASGSKLSSSIITFLGQKKESETFCYENETRAGHTPPRPPEKLVSLDGSAPIRYEAPISSLRVCPLHPGSRAGPLAHPQPPKGDGRLIKPVISSRHL
jgi:hypothetical protein